MTVPVLSSPLAAPAARLLAAAAPPSPAHDTRLVIAALLGIAVIVVLITWLKVHPFLSLTVGSLTLAVAAGLPLAKFVSSYGNGLGSTTASVGSLIALGAMLGRLLADSGGADQIVDSILGKSRAKALPWAMALVAALIGLPMFFEIGLVLLIPVILLVARRGNHSLIRIGMPALAGLSVLHGLVPPHPGPLAAIGALKADLGLTLGLGILLAIPCVILAGPIFGNIAARWVSVPVPGALVGGSGGAAPADGAAGLPAGGAAGSPAGSRVAVDAPAVAVRRPAFGVTVATVLLPVLLMLAKALADILLPKKSVGYLVLDFLGTPLIALLIAVVVAMFTLGRAAGFTRDRLSGTIGEALPPIAGILLIVAAGGGFKQVLVDAKVGDVITHLATGANFSPLLLGWLVAVAIRIATGSATVATISAAGIVAPLAAGLPPTHTALLTLAVGTGSLFFSHVNDAGFWLVKEYFGMSVGQTIKTWSIMETIISVVGIVLVLLLGVVI